MQQQHKFGVRLTPLLAVVVTLGQIGGISTAQAQSVDALTPATTPNGTRPLDLVINTDAGVDDAAALAWLLSQKDYPVNILGIGTVAGDTTVDNATNNVLTVLDTLGQQNIPVAVGAAAPLSEPLSRTGSLLHGPDGFWGTGAEHPHDLSSLSHDVPSFYRDLAQTHPGATLLSLGPVTNLARTLEQYPDAMRSFKQIIILGGAKNGGNITPNAEFNIWQDPEAANELLSAGLPITIVPLDAFNKFTLTSSNLQTLQTQGSQAAKLIAGPLKNYAVAQTSLGGATDASIPDVAAAIYAVDSSLGTTQSALVKVVTQPGLARGETDIGLTLIERVSLIASDAELSQLADQVLSDPTFDLSTALGDILAREPDNATLVTDIEQARMRELFLSALAPVSVPEPSCVPGLLAISAFGAAGLLKRKRRTRVQSSATLRGKPTVSPHCSKALSKLVDPDWQ